MSALEASERFSFKMCILPRTNKVSWRQRITRKIWTSKSLKLQSFALLAWPPLLVWHVFCGRAVSIRSLSCTFRQRMGGGSGCENLVRFSSDCVFLQIAFVGCISRKTWKIAVHFFPLFVFFPWQGRQTYWGKRCWTKGEKLGNESDGTVRCVAISHQVWLVVLEHNLWTWSFQTLQANCWSADHIPSFVVHWPQPRTTPQIAISCSFPSFRNKVHVLQPKCLRAAVVQLWHVPTQNSCELST